MAAPSNLGRRSVILGVAPIILLLLGLLAWRFVPANAETPDPITDGWEGEYFAFYSPQGMDPRVGSTPQTRPAMIRKDADIDFDWGKGSPGTGVPADQFSVRWTRVARFPEGTYRFNIRSDDGFRLYIDDALKLDRWFDSRNLDQSVDIKINEGKHKLRVEYYENWGNALIRVGWEPIPEGVPTSTVSAPPALGSSTPANATQSQPKVGQAPPATAATTKSQPTIQPPAESSPKSRPTGNLLANGGFEQDSNGDGLPDGWTVSIADSEFGLATGQSNIPEGKRVAIFQPSQKSFTVSQDIEAEHNEDYQFDARVNIPNSSGWFRLSIILIPLNDQGQPLATMEQAAYGQPTSGWVEVKNRVTTPTYTSKLRVQLKADVMRATAYLDDLQLQLAKP